MDPMKRYSLYLVSCLAVVNFSGCAETSTKAESFSETEACQRLQSLITDHANQFKNHKKNLSQHRTGNVWTAEPAIPTAHNCQIWEWGGNLTNYYCRWEVEDEEDQAKASYEKGVDIVQECLGNGWKSETNKTSSGGEHTLFSKEGSATVVSIRYFNDKRAWFDSWNNTLIVGDRSNLDAPMQ